MTLTLRVTRMSIINLSFGINHILSRKDYISNGVMFRWKQRDIHEQLLGKFCLEMTEEQAIEHFERLLNDISPLVAMLDQVHNWAQYWRA